MKYIIDNICSKFLAILILASIFSSCENELNVNSDYKETVVIFGLLNPDQPKQYIKINKAFITNQQSVTKVAQIEDSLYFADIKAELYEEQTGKVIPLTAEHVGNKRPGIFLDSPNYLFTTTEPIFASNTYQVRVENLKTGNKADARTDVVGRAIIFAPSNFFDTEFTISNQPKAVIPVHLKAGVNARLYDVILDFDYEEFSAFDTFTKFKKRITWKIMDSRSASNQEIIKTSLPKDLFFDLLEAQIEKKVDWVRRPVGFRVTYVGGGEELANYISVSKPSIGIVQKQTEYTNIRNGLGLFSSRNIFVSTYLSPSSITINSLASDPKTAALGF